MNQFLSKPDWYIGLSGHLDFTLNERRVPGAPPFMRGLRALFIADTHISHRTTDADLDAFVKRIGDIDADLILWGGDFADTSEQALRLIARLDRLKPCLGSFAAPGNNDREAWPRLKGLKRALAASGVRLLVNASEVLRLPGGDLVIAGIDEYFLGAPNSRNLYLRESSPRRWRLLISHFPILPENLPDLMLSGHTHGGQFNLLGLTPYSIGFERIFSRRHPPAYVAGLYASGDTRLLVSKGIGASRIPLRIGVRPEIELLRFD